MGLFGRKQEAADPGVGLYGKHPTAGDFLRQNASSQALRAFDEWLSGALTVAQRAADWTASYEAGGILRFLFLHPARGSGGALLGAMAPSNDRSGRQFPLVIFTELSLELAVQEQPWLGGCRFLDEAGALLGRRSGLGKDALLGAAAALAPLGQTGIAEGKQRVSRYLENINCSAAFSAMFAGSTGGQAERALVALEEGCRSSGNFALGCPLATDIAGDVGVWMKLVEAFSRGKLMPGMLWGDHLLLLFVGRFTPRALLPLWRSNVASDDLYDLRTVRPTYSRSIPTDQCLAEWLTGLR